MKIELIVLFNNYSHNLLLKIAKSTSFAGLLEIVENKMLKTVPIVPTAKTEV